MSSSTNAPGSPSLPRLGPTWRERGFQPPPAVPAERVTRTRSSSAGSSDSEKRPPNLNKFSVLDDDEDVVAGSGEQRKENSRSEGLRSTYNRSSSGGTRPGGRSLADLAARTPGVTRSGSGSHREEGGGGARFSGPGGSGEETSVKVIRFTREKLLSMRVPPKADAESPPARLKHLEGTPIISSEPQDPVCWDPFDPDEIWAQVPRERVTRSGSVGEREPPKGRIPARDDEGRRSSTGPGGGGGGRWERGVALPPPDETKSRGHRGDADNPDELWDDPIGGSTGAAADFSSFGEIPDDPKSDRKSGGGAFDFDKMTEATRRFEMERHGSKGSDIASDGEEMDSHVHSIKVNPHRPLAGAGTTIQSGSGDDVNVFEDFDENTGEPDSSSEPAVKSDTVDAEASSLLMKMIGVNNDVRTEERAEAAPVEFSDKQQPDPWGVDSKSSAVQDPSLAAIPSNPWGSAIGSDANQQQGGLDLAARLESVVAVQKAREAKIAVEVERRKVQEAELLRRRQQEEDAKQQALRAQQEQAEAAQSRQGQHSQVELVLVERISAFLENSWGRSDLVSILTTLHSEDSRVIPLLGNVDALRALIARHPARVSLHQDPAFGAEMAVLLLTNTQWQQQRRAREAELQRAEQQRRLQALQHAAAHEKSRTLSISADASWFYSDPQKNIQGPFRGEEMRQWLEAGYFKGDLPISQQPGGPFVPLQALFPDLQIAFKFPGQNQGDDEAAAAAAEEERRSREAQGERRAAEERALAEQRTQAEAKASADAEQERRQKEAAAKKQAATTDQKQSVQLKMMLGLSQLDEPAELAEENGRDAPTEETQLNSNTRPHRNQPASTAPAASKAPAACAAWGGAASAAPRKGISEIQQEEARAAARLAMERKNVPRSSRSGWANVAASKGGSTGWSSGTVRPTPAAVVTNANAAPSVTNARMTQASPAQPSTQPQASAATAQRPQFNKDEFGASMPPGLEKWCKDQMKKLNGSDDLTLVSFCMTLTDPDEIRQYLTAYLGSTPHVNNFASEFIRRKNGEKSREEWESAGKTKKGKKKK